MKYILFSLVVLLHITSFASPPLEYTRFGQNLTSMDSQNPVQLQPIRYAKGHLEVTRFESELVSGGNDVKTYATVICNQNMDIPVYDVRNQLSFYYTGTYLTCSDTIKNEKITLRAYGNIVISNILTPGMTGDFKVLATSGYAEQASFDIPRFGDQVTFTPDLNQKYFGTISYPPIGVTCMAPPVTSPNPPNPPHIQFGSNATCKVLHPVGYMLTWVVEDTP